MRVKWCINNGTDDDKIIEWEKNVRYFWVTSIFYSHSGLIPSFLMRKNEKNQIPPTRDQKIVTLDWMNPILNDGLREPRGRILNKGQPLRFFSSSFHCHLTVFSSFNTHSVTRMSGWQTNICIRGRQLIHIFTVLILNYSLSFCVHLYKREAADPHFYGSYS